MPKSGSTWLTSLFSNLPLYKSVEMVPVFGAREQELESYSIELAFQANPTEHLISQNHVKYNKHTRKMLGMYCMRPIVLTRSIKDNLVSLVDHWRLFGPIPNFNLYISLTILPLMFLHPPLFSISLEYAVRLHTPWILNFYLSWANFESSPFSSLPPVLHPIFVSYESLQQDTFNTFRSILTKLGMSYSDEQVALAIEKASTSRTRKNKGIIGRGEDLFDKDPSVHQALKDILKLYSRGPLLLGST